PCPRPAPNSTATTFRPCAPSRKPRWPKRRTNPLHHKETPAMLKRTILTLMAAAGLGATALTGPASAQMADAITEPVTITFYNYNLATASNGADATRELIARFEEENPLVTVETVAVPSNEIITRLQADMAAG